MNGSTQGTYLVSTEPQEVPPTTETAFFGRSTAFARAARASWREFMEPFQLSGPVAAEKRDRRVGLVGMTPPSGSTASVAQRPVP